MEVENTTTHGQNKDFLLPKTKFWKRKQPHVDTSEITDPAVVGSGSKSEIRRILVSSHRYTPLQKEWLKMFTKLVENRKLNVRLAGKETQEIGALQRAEDFVKAFILGFDVEDALALLRLDHLYLESFDVTDVKPLKCDHLARAVSRLAGKNGKTKFTIENVTTTRIVLADSKIHILGSYQNIQIARKAICNLILGSAPSKVNGQMRTVAQRAASRF
ncbi:unnamed protein product [Candidula unifasciata]|uniref:K Homology domain-containing protein n=1 Tax=Candidula unifasciata TaxID=100452 RepID=A0A8S3YCX4_9EUPU|nr:unnamed protein product [Candidula unifasciata]